VTAAVLSKSASIQRLRAKTTQQFIAHAERISGQNLQTFFDVWLYQEGKPTTW